MGQSLVRFLNLYVGTGTGYLGTAFVTFVMFTLWGIASFALLEYVMEDDDVEKVKNGVDFLLAITGIVYYRWLLDLLSGYETEPTQLAELLKTLPRLASYISSCYYTSSSRYGNHPTPLKNNNDDKIRNVQKTYQTLDALCHYSVKLYLKSDNGKSYDRDDLKQILSGVPTSGFSSDEEIATLLTTSMSIHLSHLQKLEILNDQQYTIAWGLFAPIYSKWNGLHVKLEAPHVSFLNDWMLTIIFFYFILIIPFQMFLSIRLYMVFFYPVSMTLFTLPYIIRKWLGNPLDASNPFGTQKYFRWRDDIQYEIKQSFPQSLSS